MDSDFTENDSLVVVAVEACVIPGSAVAAVVSPSIEDMVAYVQTPADIFTNGNRDILLTDVPTDATDGHIGTSFEAGIELTSAAYSKSAIQSSSNIPGKSVLALNDNTHKVGPAQNEVTHDGAASNSGYKTSTNNVVKDAIDGIHGPVDNATKDFIETQPTSLEGFAVLLLTSRSTGNAKAVCLSHEQVLMACRASYRICHYRKTPFF